MFLPTFLRAVLLLSLSCGANSILAMDPPEQSFLSENNEIRPRRMVKVRHERPRASATLTFEKLSENAQRLLLKHFYSKNPGADELISARELIAETYNQKEFTLQEGAREYLKGLWKKLQESFKLMSNQSVLSQFIFTGWALDSASQEAQDILQIIEDMRTKKPSAPFIPIEDENSEEWEEDFRRSLSKNDAGEDILEIAGESPFSIYELVSQGYKPLAHGPEYRRWPNY